MRRRESVATTGFLGALGLALMSDVLYVDPLGRDRVARGKEPWSPLQTLAAAVDKAAPGDVIVCGPGAYDEAVVIPEGKGLTVVGTGGRGAAYIEPSTVAASGLTVLADDVTLINVGVAGEDTADAALIVGSAAISPARFRAFQSKIEGALALLLLRGAGDVLIEDCEFAWSGSGVLFDNNDNGFCTQITTRKNRFHNLTTVHVGLAAAGGVRNWVHEDNVHDRAEDGTAPTDFIKVDGADDTGLVVGNRIAYATNEADVLTVGAKILWGPNATEAGWSTARPS